MGNAPPPFPLVLSSHSHFYKLSHSKVAGQVMTLLPSPASLFIYSSVRDCPSPPLWLSWHPALFVIFFLLLLLLCIKLILFSFLPEWESVCPGAMLIWHRVVCGSTTCRFTHLVVCFSRAGTSWHLVVQEPSWFLHLLWSGDAMRGLGVWRSWDFDSSRWFFL
jgi:hypothetical protein